jgi:VanZ family protein
MTESSSRDTRVLSYIFPAVLWALTIFVESSIPSSSIPESEIFKFDKLIHCGIYFIFAVLLYRALRMNGVSDTLRSRAWLVTLAIIALYGASDEFHQYFVPGRAMEFFDWVADVTGGILWVTGIGIYNRIQSRRAVHS